MSKHSQTLHSFYSPHDRVTINFGDKLITKQSMAAECDINNIIKQFSKTGIVNHINNSQQQYINLPDNMDFQQSIHIINEAEQAFSTLPSKVREYFQNDPGRFLSALTNPAERDRLTEYGIFKKQEAQTPPSSPTPTPTQTPPEGSQK